MRSLKRALFDVRIASMIRADRRFRNRRIRCFVAGARVADDGSIVTSRLCQVRRKT
jgi:hypothetical protein